MVIVQKIEYKDIECVINEQPQQIVELKWGGVVDMWWGGLS